MDCGSYGWQDFLAKNNLNITYKKITTHLKKSNFINNYNVKCFLDILKNTNIIKL